MKCFVLLTVLVFASKNENDAESVAANSGEKMENVAENSIMVKIEEDKYDKKKNKISNYIGVSYDGTHRWWIAQRWSKIEKKIFKNSHRDEDTAAHASDTLARKLMTNGEQNHKLNFPYDNTEVYPEEKTTYSKYFGVTYYENLKRWSARRWSRTEKTLLFNGSYKDEATAAHASDTLARKLMENGKQNHKLNFPDDSTEVYPIEKTTSSKFIGVYDNEKMKLWVASRHSKNERKTVHNGYYKDEETAAHASDTLARKLMANGEQNHKLNFPDDKSEVHPKEIQTNKRKRSFDFGYSQENGNNFEKLEEKEK